MATPEKNLSVASFNLLSEQMTDDPFPVWDELRKEHPVFWSERHESWILTAYNEVRDALKRDELSVQLGDQLLARVDGSHPLHRYIKKWMVFCDAPDHTRLRALVARAFTPGVIGRLHDDVQQIVDELLNELASEGGGDFMQDFAGPLPALVIAEMFGLPRSDRQQIGHWSNAISSVIHRDLMAERFGSGAEAMMEFAEYLQEHFDRVRKSPDETMLSRLVNAREDGDLLSDDELIATVMLFLFAGHETTTALLGNGLLALQRELGGLGTLKKEQAMKTVVEELLRYDGPGRLLVRHVKQPLEIGGFSMSKGQRVFLAIASANRDPSVFERADKLMLDRDPNRHLGFGVGIHFCIGANLARLETQIALKSIQQKFSSLTVDTEQSRWRPVMISRCLAKLPYRID